jgi:hypothetical protein
MQDLIIRGQYFTHLNFFLAGKELAFFFVPSGNFLCGPGPSQLLDSDTKLFHLIKQVTVQ